MHSPRLLFELPAALVGQPLTAYPWQVLRDRGFAAVWLMGVWERSGAARREALTHPDLRREYDRTLPGWTDDVVVASPYAIRRYTPDPQFGDFATLQRIRDAANAAGLKLFLDFVPNHLARDHDWTGSRPECFVQPNHDALRRHPDWFFTRDSSTYLAHGKDPNFPPWTDTAQINFFEPRAREALIGELVTIAAYCDGVRCDMAMLALNDVFANTWGWTAPGAMPATEFWHDAIAAVGQRHRSFEFIAEAYWGLEGRLLQLGFDAVYDRNLYSTLCHGDARAVRDHLADVGDDVARHVHFIENHDEARAAAVLGSERSRAAAAVIATLPGIALIHEGQREGRRVRLPVQLRHPPDEAFDASLAHFYDLLLRSARPLADDADWAIREVMPPWESDDSHRQILAWTWCDGRTLIVVAVNYSESRAHGRIVVDLPPGAPIEFRDRIDQAIYTRERDEIRHPGLYVELSPWQAHIFEAALE